MSKTFKALSALLSYPEEVLQKAAPELRKVLDEEALLPPERRAALDTLIEEIATTDLLTLQEHYVELFDRTRSLSLHLFEHVHGESRDRGQAMIDLKTLYEQNGLYLSSSELPDYLPAFLEFLSIRPLEEARAQLSQPAHILTALTERLHKRQSSYAAVFEYEDQDLRFITDELIRQPAPIAGLVGTGWYKRTGPVRRSTISSASGRGRMASPSLSA